MHSNFFMLFVLQKYLNWTMHVKNMEINYFTFSFFDISWQFSEFRLLMKGRWPLLIFVGYARVFKEDVSLHFYFDTSVILSDKSLKNVLNFFSFLVILYAFVFLIFFFSRNPSCYLNTCFTSGDIRLSNLILSRDRALGNIFKLVLQRPFQVLCNFDCNSSVIIRIIDDSVCKRT